MTFVWVPGLADLLSRVLDQVEARLHSDGATEGGTLSG